MEKDNLLKIDWNSAKSVWHDPVINFAASVYSEAAKEVSINSVDDIKYHMFVSANNELVGRIDSGVVSVWILRALREALYALCLVTFSVDDVTNIAIAIERLEKYEDFLKSIDLLNY